MVDATWKTHPPCHRLPAELWLEVGSHFPSTRTLAIACRVCKLWYAHFTPILYETFIAAAREEPIFGTGGSGLFGSYPGVFTAGGSRGSLPTTRRYVFRGDMALISNTRSVHINAFENVRESYPCFVTQWSVENLDNMPRLQSLHVSDHGTCPHCDPNIDRVLCRLYERGTLRGYTRVFNTRDQRYQQLTPLLANLESLNLWRLRADTAVDTVADDIARIVVRSPGLRELGLSLEHPQYPDRARLVVAKILERHDGPDPPLRLRKLRLGHGFYCVTQETETDRDISAVTDLSYLEHLDLSTYVEAEWAVVEAGREHDLQPLDVFYPCARLRRLAIKAGIFPCVTALVRHLQTTYRVLSELQLGERDATTSLKCTSHTSTRLMDELGGRWTYMDLSQWLITYGHTAWRPGCDPGYPDLEFLFLPVQSPAILDNWFSCLSAIFPRLRHLACETSYAYVPGNKASSSFLGESPAAKLANITAKFKQHEEAVAAQGGKSVLQRISVGDDTFAREHGPNGWGVSMGTKKEYVGHGVFD